MKIKMNIFEILDKAKPDTEGIRGLNLAALRCTTMRDQTAVVALAAFDRA
jgi:hypothetical protein